MVASDQSALFLTGVDYSCAGILSGMTIFLVLAVALLVFILTRRPPNKKSHRPVPEHLPVAIKSPFFSRTEWEFYGRLTQAVPSGYVVLAQVRLQDIFTVQARKDDYQRVYRRMADKHVDFLIVRVSGSVPILAFELDGKSHDAPEQKHRDAVKEVLFRSAGLPLVRYKNAEIPDTRTLGKQLKKYL